MTPMGEDQSIVLPKWTGPVLAGVLNLVLAAAAGGVSGAAGGSAVAPADVELVRQAQLGRRIDWRRARLGDLVVYTRRNGTLRHAMLALGNGWVVGARGGDENVAANRPSAFIDLRRADYWSSALSHAVATGAAA